ncbi:unnamed protein product [Prorocentrum cordatum]|uniref:Uncharacterized protein n=1 Tax=Prorocentrum cordatum TaxID=2364126 RepID=A0ABN9QJN2_9DINO|nr:unnamed protein product [Polarella glacialis]
MRAKPTPRPRIGDVPKRAGGRRASMLAWAAGGPPPWGHDRRRNRIVEMGGAGMGGERQVHPPSQRGSGIYGPGSIQTRVSRGGRGASVIRLRPATACLTARLWDSG